MKKLLPLLFVLMGLGSAAQIVNIPDANFKNALVNYSDVSGRRIDTNNDGEIQYSEAAGFSFIGGGYILAIDNQNISDLTGIQAFIYLSYLNCNGNHLTNLDISGLPIRQLFCRDNNLTSINLAGCNFLYSIDCSNNQLSSINLSSQNSTFESLVCSNNNISVAERYLDQGK